MWSTAAEAAEVKPADVKMAKQQPQDSVRYFTDWVLPQLDGLIDDGSIEFLPLWGGEQLFQPKSDESQEKPATDGPICRLPAFHGPPGGSESDLNYCLA